MVRVIFKCSENMNKYKETMDFDDDVTDEIIREAFVDWVWAQVGDNFTWYRESEE